MDSGKCFLLSFTVHYPLSTVHFPVQPLRDLSRQSDDALMAALVTASPSDGTAQALFDELFRRHAQEAHAFAWRIARDAQAAEEIVQDAFARIWNLRERYRAGPEDLVDEDDDDPADRAEPSGRRFLAWFYTILRNLARDALRRRSHRPVPLPPEAFSDRADPRFADRDGSERAIQAERQQRVELAVANLEPALQEVVVLRLHEELTLEKVGDRLGLTPQGVRKRLLRAFEILRRELSEI